MERPFDDWVVRVDADTAPLQRELQRVSTFGERFGRSLTRAFEGAALRGRNLGDVVQSLGQRLSHMAFRAAFKPLEQGIGSLFSNIFSGATGFARGGAFRSGQGGAMPVPFASGGVVSSPTFFPLAGGRTGVMGERGAEAILPLKRGPDGRLGVGAQAGGGISITFNVSAADADSFVRSETQIAAMLSRAVTRGQRNL